MWKLKKVHWLSLIVAVVLIVTSIYTLSDAKTKNGDATSNLEFSSEMYEIKSIDDMIKYSDNVIIGTVTDGEDFDNALAKFKVTVDKSFKGIVTSSDIDVYEVKGTFQIGKQYILFLGSFES